jgi:hypothetical protein
VSGPEKQLFADCREKVGVRARKATFRGLPVCAEKVGVRARKATFRGLPYAPKSWSSSPDTSFPRALGCRPGSPVTPHLSEEVALD